MTQNIFSRLALIIFAMGAMFFSTAGFSQNAPATKGKFIELTPAQPTEPGKIEVLEFFSYGCGHCAAIEPLLEKWIKAQSADVIVRGVPVAFNASMKPLQRLYYALEALNRMDLHPKVFQAIHQEKKRLFTKAEIKSWIATQGVDPEKFDAAFESFGVSSKTGRADQLVTAYRIQGTPTVSVAGRFVTSPSEAGGYQQTLDVASELIRQVRGK
ncbi:thiol:disulfide interchange protein DsbA/DsbL [Zwartia panacis]|uniref:thiol:disulfide interchange protein DsbA/DsbL n=1 Tax=Zwartia panacis TaxID=2683345 RepID=UPI0025B442CA|nr:thiol:disulfide interchange protein DsbA/DsbL [Zwartia panacis]MDN4017049.1 thiol:disulfide interchange protein DsbA/DsbL [Zwartia panacis]